MVGESRPKKKATKKQQIVVGFIIAGIAIGGLFAVVFGIAEIVDIPERDSSGYSIFFAIAIGVMLGSIFGLIKLFSKIWNVEI